MGVCVSQRMDVDKVGGGAAMPTEMTYTLNTLFIHMTLVGYSVHMISSVLCLVLMTMGQGLDFLTMDRKRWTV